MNFLVAVDGSDASDAAVDHVAELAERLDARVTVVHAVDPSVVVEGGDEPVSYTEADDMIVQEPVEDAEARAQAVLDAAAERLREADVDVETVLLYGDPIEAIPDYAGAGEDGETPFDGLFVGHRGLSERYESMVGSVAKALVEHSPVPVTVVR
jgi:nucleotide-binding universal stress UspA family protein